MKLIDAYAKLLQLGIPIFQTADAAAYLEITNSHASQLLSRLEQSSHIVRLKRSTWCPMKTIDPLMIPEYLTAPFPSYVSLHSALYYHGMIDQIPAVIYAVSPARTRIYHNAIATYSIHHVAPNFFTGFEMIGASQIKMATPEKAIIDFFYLGFAKSKLFRALPELELPQGFKTNQAEKIIKMIESSSRRTHVVNRFNALIKKTN